MSRRRLLLAAAVLVAIGAAFAAGVLVESEEEISALVDRPSDRGRTDEPAKTVRLDDRARPLPLTRRQRTQRLAPEEGRLPPLSQAELVESSDFAATELEDRSDPSGGEDAYALFSSTLVHKGAAFVAEPMVAAKGDRMLAVWNWGAAFSNDGGQTFTYVNPATAFPPAAGGFCCDQVAYYAPEQDLWIWFLQYRLRGNRNVARIAFARGDTGFDQRRFQYYDLTASDLPEFDVAGEAELDYPNISATREHLFLAINVCSAGRCGNTVVVRIPIDELLTGRRFSFDHVSSGSGGIDFAEGATDTMYFAEHVDTSTLRVWRWEDGSRDPVSADVPHSSYRRTFRGAPYTCKRSGGETGDWCRRATDDRLTSGWLTEDAVGFAWNAAQDRQRGFPYPFVMTVRIDRATMQLEDEPFIWSPRHAYLYAAFSPNARGDIGGVALAGGGDRYQTCATLIRDSQTQGWEAHAADASDSDPDENEAGDYLGVIPATPGANLWTASCMRLRGGSTEQDVEIRAFRFGRVKDRDG